MDFDMLRQYREGNRLEFKRAKGGLPRSFWETYSAFANTNGGFIVLGAEEEADGHPVPTGVTNPDALLKDLWDGLNNPERASVNVLVDSDVEVADFEGRKLVCVHVPRTDRHLRPVFVNNNPKTGTYRRNGEGDYHVTDDVLRAMARDSLDSSADKLVLEEFSLDDLNAGTIQAYRNSFRAIRPEHPWVDLPDTPFLMRIGDWSGNVFDFWHKAYPMLIESLPVPFRLDANMRRIDVTPQHRAVALALTNALVHADYFGRTGVVVIREPGRVITRNPGTLRIGLDEVEAGGISDPRNETLLFMFSMVNIGERAGSGFDVLREGAYSAGKPEPLLEEFWEPDRVRLTLELETSGLTSFRLPGMGGETGPLVTETESPRSDRSGVGNVENVGNSDQADVVDGVDNVVNVGQDGVDGGKSCRKYQPQVYQYRTHRT